MSELGVGCIEGRFENLALGQQGVWRWVYSILCTRRKTHWMQYKSVKSVLSPAIRPAVFLKTASLVVGVGVWLQPQQTVPDTLAS